MGITFTYLDYGQCLTVLSTSTSSRNKHRYYPWELQLQLRSQTGELCTGVGWSLQQLPVIDRRDLVVSGKRS